MGPLYSSGLALRGDLLGALDRNHPELLHQHEPQPRPGDLHRDTERMCGIECHLGTPGGGLFLLVLGSKAVFAEGGGGRLVALDADLNPRLEGVAVCAGVLQEGRGGVNAWARCRD